MRTRSGVLYVFGAVFYTVAVGMFVWFAVRGTVGTAQTKLAEKPPAAQRSLERIDCLNEYGFPDVCLCRVMTCYYVVFEAGSRIDVLHLESCPSSGHQRIGNAMGWGIANPLTIIPNPAREK